MYMDFNAFTRMFFYLFVCYHYAKHHYPEKMQQFVIFVCYNSIHLYSKLQILLNKKLTETHNILVKYQEYQKCILFLQKIKEEFNISLSTKILQSQTNEMTMDFILNNEIDFSFEKNEFINEYLEEFFPGNNDNQDDDTEDNESEDEEKSDESLQSLGRKALERILLPDEIDEEIVQNVIDDLHTERNNANANTKSVSDSDVIIDYDFIVINGEDNLKKIIKHVDLIKNDFISEYSSIFQLEPFLYKPILCEFLNGDDTTATKIDFCDNNKFYDFLVVGNCFDKTFLTYFMKKYYEIHVKDNYILKILDNNVNTLIFESSDILKFDDNCISKIKTNL